MVKMYKTWNACRRRWDLSMSKYPCHVYLLDVNNWGSDQRFDIPAIIMWLAESKRMER